MEMEISRGKVIAINNIIRAFGSNPAARLNDEQIRILIAMRKTELDIQNKLISKMFLENE